MLFKRLKVSNFKSFKSLDIELAPFNVLVGANASGKSNFVQIFRFLRDIREAGLRNAISMQGGVEYLRNLQIGSTTELSVEFSTEPFSEDGLAAISPKILRRRPEARLRLIDTSYRLTIQFTSKAGRYSVSEERLTQKFFVDMLRGEPIEPAEATVILSRRQGRIEPTYECAEHISEFVKGFLIPWIPPVDKMPDEAILLRLPLLPLFEPYGIGIYDIDPRLPKQAISITGKSDLEEDGSNLAIVLERVLSNKQAGEELYRLLKYLLPFIDSLEVERLADKRLLLRLKEKYDRKRHLPASFVSDGTMHVVALLTALFMERSLFCAIEEPERNIHPSLMSRLVELMKDASKYKQILVTTHNPEFVRYAGVGNLLLIGRDEEGFSTISRPCDMEMVRIFLENEIGIDELYVQNLLGA